jgi:hypothetical protein
MMLARRGVSCTIYLGLQKGGDRGDPLSAHAWLRSGRTVLTGAEGVKLSSYTVISMFASEGSG